MIPEEVFFKRFAYSFLDGTSSEFLALVGRKGLEFKIYAFQIQDAFGPQRTGNSVQACYFPVTRMSAFGKLSPPTIRPVLNAAEERVHGIVHLVEVATREELSTLFVLSSSLLSPQPRSAACLKHSSSQSCEPSDDGT